MRTRFSLRLSPFTSFPFSQARKHNWPEYSLWDHGPTCIVGQVICLGPRSHLHRRHIISLGQRLSNAWHEQVLACRQQLVERSNHAAGLLLQAMVKALLGNERSMHVE